MKKHRLSTGHEEGLQGRLAGPPLGLCPILTRIAMDRLDNRQDRESETVGGKQLANQSNAFLVSQRSAASGGCHMV
eukprot:364651-Chlamydomonas_euryale.AAC.4